MFFKKLFKSENGQIFTANFRTQLKPVCIARSIRFDCECCFEVWNGCVCQGLQVGARRHDHGSVRNLWKNLYAFVKSIFKFLFSHFVRLLISISSCSFCFQSWSDIDHIWSHLGILSVTSKRAGIAYVWRRLEPSAIFPGTYDCTFTSSSWWSSLSILLLSNLYLFPLSIASQTRCRLSI